MISTASRWLLSAAMVVLLATSGCNKQAKPTLMANMAKEDVTVSQLRAVDYEYAARFGHAVAACALQITAATDDRDMVEHALRWRMWALPQARAAAFDQDPLTALIELWILANQQHKFFTEGEGRAWFGEHQALADATTLDLKSKAEVLLSQTMTPQALRAIQETKRSWIETHPIEGELVFRPTARADLANLVPPQQGGTLQAVASIQETVGDMNDRITILTQQAPVEARWQAEYLVASLFDDRAGDLDTVVGSIAKMTGFLDGFEEQTAAIFDAIENERSVVFDAIERERAQILAALTAEREAILTGVDAQLVKTTSSIDEVARGLIDEAAGEIDGVGRRLIDHFFIRSLELIVVVFLGALLFRWIITRRRKEAVVEHHDRSE